MLTFSYIKTTFTIVCMNKALAEQKEFRYTCLLFCNIYNFAVYLYLFGLEFHLDSKNSLKFRSFCNLLLLDRFQVYYFPLYDWIWLISFISYDRTYFYSSTLYGLISSFTAVIMFVGDSVQQFCWRLYASLFLLLTVLSLFFDLSF